MFLFLGYQVYYTPARNPAWNPHHAAGLIRMNSGAICALPGSTTSAHGLVLAAGICGSNPNSTGGWMRWNNLPIFPLVMFGRKQIFYLQLHIWWPRRNAGGAWLVLLDSCCTWRIILINLLLSLSFSESQDSKRVGEHHDWILQRTAGAGLLLWVPLWFHSDR